MLDNPILDRPLVVVDTAVPSAAAAPASAASSSSSSRRPDGQPAARSRSSFSGTSTPSEGLTSPNSHHYNPHPYGAITTSSGNLTRSNSVPSSLTWVPSHQSSRSLSSMDQQQPRPLPTPPTAQASHGPTRRAPVPRAHRRADSAPFVFPPSTLSSQPLKAVHDLPRDPAEWSHAQLLQWLEVRLAEAGLAKPVVHDVLAWLGTSRNTAGHGSRVGGLSLDGKEFMKGEQGAWAKTGTKPPFHNLLFQCSHNLRNRRHPRQASTVLEADEEDDATPVKRLMRDWEERSSSSASEYGSDDDDIGAGGDKDKLLKSPSARRSRESEKRYRRRSSIKNVENGSASTVRNASGSSSEISIAALATPPPPPYQFDSAVIASSAPNPTLLAIDSTPLVKSFDAAAAVLTPSSAGLRISLPSHTLAVESPDIAANSPNRPSQHGFFPSPTSDDATDALLRPSTLTRRERKSYDGLGSGFGFLGSGDESGDGGRGEREERRVMTVKPRKPSGPPPSACTTFGSPVKAAGADEADVAQLKALVATLSDRMKTLESRLDSFESRAAAPDPEPVLVTAAAAAEDPPPLKSSTMGYRHLPGYIALVSLGVVIIAWGVFSRGRRGGRA